MVHISELTPKPGERVLTIGGTRAGKSSLMDWEVREIQTTRPQCMQIIVDTKPRFRAQYRQLPSKYLKHAALAKKRIKADKLYSAWSAGPVVPNSVVMDIWRKNPFMGLWTKERPGEVVIMQGAELADWRRMLALLRAFVNANMKGRERRVIVDEALDFYQRNTFGIDSKNDVFYRIARAGAERGIGLELGAHRVHGLPPLVLNMSSRVNLFHLRDDSDLKYLRQAVGITDAESPQGDYVFRQWTVQPGGKLSEPFTGRVTYPESYLKQLAST